MRAAMPAARRRSGAMQSTERRMRNCTSGNLEIPGSRFARPGMTGDLLADPAKPEIRRDSSLPRGLLPVARHGVAIPWLAPIGSPLGGPDEIARTREMRQRPG